MKTVLVALLLVVLLAGAGFYGLPLMIERETSGLESELGDVKLRLQKAEEFIRIEEEAGKGAQLQPGADVQKVIKAVNDVSSRVSTLEGSLSKGMASTNEAMKKQMGEVEEASRKQAEAIDKLNKETQAKLQKIMLDAKMANIRGHIAKARMDLISKNIATAKTELELVGGIFETLRTSVAGENRKGIEELEAILKKARSEVDTDLPAAVNRVDLLWYEMSKLLRKN